MSANNKTFISNLLMLIGVNLLIKPFYVLVIEAQAQERIGAENFGLYFALINLSYILNILPDLGLTNWNNRHIAQQGIVIRSELKSLLRLRLILSAIYIVICLSFAFALHYDNRALWLLLVLAFNQVLVAGVLFLRSYLSGMHQFASDRIISILDRLLLILILGGLLFITDHTSLFPLEYLVYSQTIAYGLTLVICYYLAKKLRVRPDSPSQIDTASVLKSSIPFAVLILISMMSSRTDAIMLERMTDSYQAGIYAMTFRLSDMLTMIAYLFAALLLPIFSRMLAQNNHPIEVFSIAFRLLLAGCAWVVAISIVSPEWILDFIYDKHVKEASLVLPWTIASAALFSLQYTTGTLLTAAGKMKPLISIASIAFICNVTLNLLFIPSQLATGVAKAACATQAMVFVAQAAIVHFRFRIWTKSVLVQSTIFMLIVGSAVFTLEQNRIDSSLATAALTIVIITTAIVLKMVPIREMILSIKPETISNSK
jgi:O-antigen/teichoic acid export membrane protein